MFFGILGAVLWIILAFWPAIVARKKGYSFILFFLLSIVISWLITLIIVLVLKNRNETAEDRAASQAADKVLEAEEN